MSHGAVMQSPGVRFSPPSPPTPSAAAWCPRPAPAPGTAAAGTTAGGELRGTGAGGVRRCRGARRCPILTPSRLTLRRPSPLTARFSPGGALGSRAPPPVPEGQRLSARCCAASSPARGCAGAAPCPPHPRGPPGLCHPPCPPPAVTGSPPPLVCLPGPSTATYRAPTAPTAAYTAVRTWPGTRSSSPRCPLCARVTSPPRGPGVAIFPSVVSLGNSERPPRVSPGQWCLSSLVVCPPCCPHTLSPPQRPLCSVPSTMSRECQVFPCACTAHSVPMAESLPAVAWW